MAEWDDVLIYRGLSMRSVFRPGDRLEITPTTLAKLRRGDIVIFWNHDPTARSNRTVHRVIRTVPGGVITRGDNNNQEDDIVVPAADLVGRVTHRERDGRVRRIQGGWPGLLYANLFRAVYPRWRQLKRGSWLGIARLGRWPYRWLRRSGLVARFWHPQVQRALFQTQRGPVVKYVVGARTVAYWWPERQHFSCRKPYDLVLKPPEQDPPA